MTSNPPERKQTRWFTVGEQIVLLAVGALIFVLSLTLDLAKYVLAWTQHFEWLKPDELFVTIVFLSIPLLIIIIRRYRHLKAQRDRSEAKLRPFMDSAAMYRGLVEYSPVPIIVHRGGRSVFANPATANLLGASSPEDIVGRSLADFIHPDDAVRVDEIMSQMDEPKDQARRLAFRLKRLDGEIAHVETTALYITFGGESAELVFARDVTERKRAEKALLESERQYRDVFENSQIGFYRSTPGGFVSMANPALINMLGYNTLEELQQIDIGHEMARVGYVREEFQQQIERDGFVRSLEMPWPTRDGRPLTVVENARVVRDEDGSVLYYEGSVENITDRKLAEDQLRQEKNRYRRIFESIQDVYFETDLEGTLLEISPSVEILSRHKRDNVLGKSVYDVYADSTARVVLFEAMKQTGRVEDHEISLLDADGSILKCSLIAEYLTDGAGMPIGLVGSLRDITAQEAAADALRASEQRFRNVFRTCPDSIMVSRMSDGKIVDVNDAFITDFRYAREEVVGFTTKERNIWADYSDRDGFVKRLITDKSVDNFETSFCLEDGTAVRHLVSATLIDLDGVPHILSVARDVEERLAAEQKLQQQHELLTATIDSLTHPFYLIDANDYSIKLANTAAGFGVIDGQQRCHVLTHGNKRPCGEAGIVCPVEIVKKTGRAMTVEHLHTDANGGLRSYEVHAYPIMNGDGSVASVIEYSMDITDRKKMEEELLKIQKLESVGVLAGGIAHDFNNTLTGILGNISLAKLDIPESTECFTALDEAEKAAVRAKDLTQQLLTFSKGGQPVKKAASIVEMIRESASFILRGSQVAYELEVAPDLRSVEIDSGQISQVFQNLTMNAMQAMPTGGTVSIRVENRTVSAHSLLPLAQGDFVKITFADDGHGIPADQLQRVFDPYFTTKQTGSGLGLTTTFSVIKNHGGHVAVDSQVGVGTTFRIYLPSSGGPQSESIPAAEQALNGSGKVLVMDDEDFIRELVARVLSRYGYQTVGASDGVEALRLYDSALQSGEPFDLVILDLTIPGGMGGRETMASLLKIDPHTVGIVASGYSNDPVMADPETYGFRSVVAKPFRPAELGEVVFSLMAAGEIQGD